MITTLTVASALKFIDHVRKTLQHMNATSSSSTQKLRDDQSLARNQGQPTSGSSAPQRHPPGPDGRYSAPEWTKNREPSGYRSDGTPFWEDVKITPPSPQATQDPPARVKTGEYRSPSWSKVVPNRYTDTIKRPDQVRGVKIPDENLAPSGTIAIKQFTTVSPTAGFSGVYLGPWVGSNTASSIVPRAADSGFGNGGTDKYMLGVIAGSAAVTGAPFSVAAGNTGVTGIQLTAYATYDAFVTSARLVSAKVTLWPTMAFTNNQGMFFASTISKGTFRQTLLANYSATQLEGLPNVYAQPVSDGGVSVIWLPTDATSILYQDVDSSNGDTFDLDLGGCLILATGISATSSLFVEIDLNYEYLPKSGSLQMGITTSYVDRMALDETLNACQNLDGAGKVEDDHVDEVHGGTLVASAPGSALHIGAMSPSTGSSLISVARRQGKKTLVHQEEPETMFSKLANLALSTAATVAPALLKRLL